MRRQNIVGFCFIRERTREKKIAQLTGKYRRKKNKKLFIGMESAPMLVCLSSTLSVTETFDQMSILSWQTTRPPFDVIASSNYRCLPSTHRYHVCYYFVPPFTLIDSLSTATETWLTVLTATAMTATATFAQRGQWHYAHYRYVLWTPVLKTISLFFVFVARVASLLLFLVRPVVLYLNVEQQNTVLFPFFFSYCIQFRCTD